MATHRVRTTVIIGIGIIVLLAIGTWFLVLSPRLSTSADISAQAEQTASSNTALQNRLNQTMKLAEAAPAAAADAQRLFSTMPQQADLPIVLQQISAAATRAGIAPTDITVINASVPRSVSGGTTGGEPTTAGDAATGLGASLAQLDLDISVNGTRRDLVRFITNLQGLERAMLITSTAFQTATGPVPEAGAKGKETLKVTGSMFVLQSRLPDLVANVEKLIADAAAPLGG